MDEILSKAPHCGIDGNVAELAIGGYLRVLKVSENYENSALDDILEYLGDEAKVNLKQYEKIKQQKRPVKNLIMNIVKKNPKNHKAVDAQNTKDMIEFLDRNFEGCDPEKLIKFMKIFISNVQNSVSQAVDIDEVLHMPPTPEPK